VVWLRAALALLAAGAVAVAVVSGGSPADPRTPAGLPGMPPPFLGTAVVGSGGLTAAIDAYGDVVDLRAPGPAGRALIDNPAERQAAGTVPADTGIVPRVRIGGEGAAAPWRADSVTQRYLPGTNVIRTVTRFGSVRVTLVDAAVGGELTRTLDVEAPPAVRAAPAFGVNIRPGLECEQRRSARRAVLVCPVRHPRLADAGRIAGRAIDADRRWIARALPLARAAPRWARHLYRRSLLTLRALTDRRTGAVAAGARDGWAYVWPRDAGAAALALAAAGYRAEARRVAHFLLGLDLGAAARFHGDGAPVAGRAAQGDAAGWVAVAARTAGIRSPTPWLPRRDRPDYQEGERGAYLGNTIAASVEPLVDGPETPLYGGKSAHRPGAAEVAEAFETARGLVRRAGDPGSGLDSAAAWAVRPFPLPKLSPAVRETLLSLARGRTRFGITPGEDWGEGDPWTAPTAWTAWSLAALATATRTDGGLAAGRAAAGPSNRAAGDEPARHAALTLLGDLRRAATPAGALPERVDADTGVPVSTTPLAWSHAFVALALRQLWP
jgi:hypothetical protein